MFIRMGGSWGSSLGRKVILVVEKLEELKQIIQVSRQVGAEPVIAHPQCAPGQQRRGEMGRKRRGKTPSSALSTSNRASLRHHSCLRVGKLQHCFKLLHFHIGSQVPDILTVKKAVQEAARFYAKLQKMGFPIDYLDVGGGLGVDYDGSRSAFDSSTNYTLQEYTNDIVCTYVADGLQRGESPSIPGHCQRER